MELDNPIVSFGKEFLDSGLKGIKVEGVAEMFQKTFNDADLAITVIVRRNVMYLLRDRDDATSEYAKGTDQSA